MISFGVSCDFHIPNSAAVRLPSGARAVLSIPYQPIHRWLQISMEARVGDFVLDLARPWGPHFAGLNVQDMMWLDGQVYKVPGFEVMFQRACLIPTAGWNSRSIQLNHTLFGLHTPMRRCNILGQSGSLIFQLSIWSIEMFSPKQKTCVNNGMYGVSWSELIGMVQKTVHASQALATKGPIVLFKAIWWNIIFHNIRS